MSSSVFYVLRFLVVCVFSVMFSYILFSIDDLKTVYIFPILIVLNVMMFYIFDYIVHIVNKIRGVV